MGSRLNVIQGVEGKYCENCTYQPTGVCRVLPDGSNSNGVCLVGDSPWVDEVASGKPFAGASGKYLDSILTKRGLQREDFLITNSLWCRPPKLGMNDEPEKYAEAELAAKQCRPYLDELIAERSPKVLVALGNVALRRLTGFDGIEANHSYVIQTDYGIPCVPTFHPSGILQGNHKLTIAFILAIARALECAKDDFVGTKCSIVEDPDPSYIQYSGNEAFIPGPLMCDIETPNSVKKGLNEEEAEDDPSYQIIRMGFSVNAWSGVSFPFEGDYIRRAKDLIKKAKQLIFWNKNYDLPRLRAAGFDLHPECVVIDAMWAWHWLYSDLPKALAFAAPFFYAGAPWKHLFSQRPAFYNAMDNAIQMGVFQGTKAHLEAEGRWDRFWNHCVRIDPIYVRMGAKGVKVDKEARTQFMKALEDDAVKELDKVQELLPANLRRVEVLEREPKPSNSKAVFKNPLRRRFKELVRVERFEVPAVRKDGTKVETGNGPLMKPMWKRITPFNPNSHEQIIELLLELNIKPPKARGEDRESTEAKYLKRLKDKHPILGHCVSYKNRSKLIGTYSWPLDDEDRAHTTYAFHPSTWRSSSRNVNLGNIPKRYELAQLFRALLIAEKGCKLIEIDRSAIEAVLVGYWAKSPEYIKLAKAGVHSFLVSHVLKKPVPWEVVRDTPLKEVQKILKGFKKEAGVETYEGCKRCIHGCVTGEHEVLTSRGWIRFDELTDGEPIAAWEANIITWRVPSRVIRKPWIGALNLLEGRGYSLEATPDHFIPVERNGKVKREEISSVSRLSGRIPVSGIGHLGSYNPSAVAIRLAVAIQADGSKGRKGTTFHLVKKRKQQRLEGLLAGRPYLKQPCKCHPEGYRYNIKGKYIEDALALLSNDKQFGWSLLNLSSTAREVFLSELPMWDGNVSGFRMTYHNTDVMSIDIVQTLLHLSGCQGLIRKVANGNGHYGSKRGYLVSFNHRRYASIDKLKWSNNPSIETTVYCVTVPSGLFLVRHKGVISVTGNSNYLLTPYGMHDEYEEYFPTLGSAEAVQSTYFKSPAGQAVRGWHKVLLEEVHRNKYLDNSFQYRHHFFGPIFKYNKRGKKWEVEHDGDAKRAVAFRPQSDAAAIQREDLLALETIDWFSGLLRLPTYDSLIAECPVNRVDEAIEVLANQFKKPIPELGGLTVGFEIKIGENLKDMQEVMTWTEG